MGRAVRVAVIGVRGIPCTGDGVQRHCEELYPLLKDRGMEVLLFGRRAHVPAEVARCGKYRGVRIVLLPAPKRLGLEALFHSLACAWYLILNRRWRPDVVHVHTIGAALVNPLLKAAGFCVVFTHHSQNYLHPKWGPIGRAVLRLGERFAVRFSDAIICISSELQQDLLRRHRRGGVHIPNGVSRPPEHVSAEPLEQWSLTPGSYVLAVGRLAPEKGTEDLIRAFARLGRQDLRLVLAGVPSGNRRFRKEIDGLAKRDPRVIQVGFQSGETLRSLYAHAGLFVLPSHHEGMPMALLEAMAFGVQVVASDLPVCRRLDVAEDSLFPPGAVSRLTSLMEKRLSAPGEPGPVRRGSPHIPPEYEWTHICDQVRDVYEAACQGRTCRVEGCRSG